MLVRESAPSFAAAAAVPTSRIDPRVVLVLILTLATGVVDAVSFFSLDRVFTANMSANMALLGVGAATSLGDVVGNVLALAGFVTGGVATGIFLRAGLRRGWPVVLVGLVLEVAVLLFLALVVGVVGITDGGILQRVVCFVLAAAMALQTGLARHVAVKDVNTTVATMTLFGLAADARWAGGSGDRWGRRLGVVLGLSVGGALGILGERVMSGGGLALATTIVAVAVVWFVGRLRRDGSDGYRLEHPHG